MEAPIEHSQPPDGWGWSQREWYGYNYYRKEAGKVWPYIDIYMKEPEKLSLYFSHFKTTFTQFYQSLHGAGFKPDLVELEISFFREPSVIAHDLSMMSRFIRQNQSISKA
jgi:hypothetical protein